jgi:hypothetical protein
MRDHTHSRYTYILVTKEKKHSATGPPAMWLENKIKKTKLIYSVTVTRKLSLFCRDTGLHLVHGRARKTERERERARERASERAREERERARERESERAREREKRERERESERASERERERERENTVQISATGQGVHIRFGGGPE